MFSRHIQQTTLPIQNVSNNDPTGLASKISQLSPDGEITLTSGQVMRAVFWDSVDLQAWQPINYEPVREYPDQPLTINHPASPYDLNNVAYNAMLLTELSIFRIMDDVVSPLTRGRRPFMTATDRVDLALRHHRSQWVSESANVIDLTNATFWDYQPTSQTNMRRINSAVDYVQHRSEDLERRISDVTEQPQFPGSRLLHRSVDATQSGFWNLYGFAQRTVVQLLDETLIQSVENSTDRALNAARPMPAEIRVSRQQSPDAAARR